MAKSRFFLLFSLLLVILFSCTQNFTSNPGEESGRSAFPVPSESPLIRLDYPAGWKIDTSQDYCDLIAFGPDDIYSIVTIEVMSGEGLEAYIRKYFHSFSFYEDFTVREERVFPFSSGAGRAFLYSYRETARNQDFKELAVFLEVEGHLIVIQYTAPGDLFDRYQVLFQELAATVCRPDRKKEGISR